MGLLNSRRCGKCPNCGSRVVREGKCNAGARNCAQRRRDDYFSLFLVVDHWRVPYSSESVKYPQYTYIDRLRDWRSATANVVVRSARQQKIHHDHIVTGGDVADDEAR